jgi:hypothetical protein
MQYPSGVAELEDGVPPEPPPICAPDHRKIFVNKERRLPEFLELTT